MAIQYPTAPAELMQSIPDVPTIPNHGNVITRGDWLNGALNLIQDDNIKTNNLRAWQEIERKRMKLNKRLQNGKATGTH